MVTWYICEKVYENVTQAPHATQISYISQVDLSSNVLYPEPQVTLNIYQLFNEYRDKYFFFML